MIAERTVLGIDPGNANLGWSLVEMGTGRVLRLGLIAAPRNHALPERIDTLRRAHAAAARLLYDVVPTEGLVAIVAEDLLTHGNPQSVVAQTLSHGTLAMLTAVTGAELSVVGAAKWQKTISPPVKRTHPKTGKASRGTDFADLYARIGRWISVNGAVEAVEALGRLGSVAKRSHPLDATGIAIYRAKGRPVELIQEAGPR